MVTCKESSIFRACMTATAILWAVLLVACASSGITQFEMVPPEGQVSSTSVLDEKVLLSARYLDSDQRMIYLREKGYEALGIGLRQVSLETFSLTVSNRTDQEIILDPGSIRLAVGYGPLLSPYNYAHLYMELPRGSGRQKILEDLRKAIFDKSTTIKPGEMIEKLLLFKKPEMAREEAALLFQRFYVGGEEMKATLSFKVVDLEK